MTIRKSRASRAVETAAARGVALRVFGNDSSAAVGVARRRIDTIRTTADTVSVVVLDRDGHPGGSFNDQGSVVPTTLDELIDELRELYPRGGWMSHRILAAHTGISNRRLESLMQTGRGPWPDRIEGDSYSFAPGVIDAWLRVLRGEL